MMPLATNGHHQHLQRRVSRRGCSAISVHAATRIPATEQHERRELHRHLIVADEQQFEQGAG